MMLPEGVHLAYSVFHEAWYANVPPGVDRPSIGVTASAEGGGGGGWSFVVEEADFDDHPISVRLFDDAFIAFAQIPEFFAELASGRVKDLQAVGHLLDSMGAVDETDRTQEGSRSAHASPSPGADGSPGGIV